jgi:hypothetical protein
MPKGGKRRGAGRPKGSPNKRVTPLGEGYAEVAKMIEPGKVTPLAHLMAVLNDPNETDKYRKDHAAVAAAPYLHPKIAINAPDLLNGGGILATVPVIAIPRGAQYDVPSGLIRYDGLEISPPPFEPLAPTPAITDQSGTVQLNRNRCP